MRESNGGYKKKEKSRKAVAPRAGLRYPCNGIKPYASYDDSGMKDDGGCKAPFGTEPPRSSSFSLSLIKKKIKNRCLALVDNRPRVPT